MSRIITPSILKTVCIMKRTIKLHKYRQCVWQSEYWKEPRRERSRDNAIPSDGILLILNSVKTHNDIKFPLVLLNSICTSSDQDSTEFYPHIFPSGWPCVPFERCTAHRDLWPQSDIINRKWWEQLGPSLQLHGQPVFTVLLICLSPGGDRQTSDRPSHQSSTVRWREGVCPGTHNHTQFCPTVSTNETLIVRFNIKTDPQAQWWYCQEKHSFAPLMLLLPMASTSVYKHHLNAVTAYHVETAHNCSCLLQKMMQFFPALNSIIAGWTPTNIFKSNNTN